MKKLMMKKLITCVILAIFAVLFTAGDVGAKSVLPKKNKTPIATREDSSDNQKSEKAPFFGGKSNKKDSEYANKNLKIEKTKKPNPVTEFFYNIGKKKKTNQEVELPAEKASANSSLRGVENASRFQKYGEPVNEKPPFAPSYGIDRTTETVSDDSAIPDSVILEDVPSENTQIVENSERAEDSVTTNDEMILEDVPATNSDSTISSGLTPPPIWGEETAEVPPSSEPILASTDSAIGQQVPYTQEEVILEDVPQAEKRPTESTFITKEVENETLPPVPSKLTMSQMAPENAPMSEPSSNPKRFQEPVYESDLDSWNQEIPQLEFMEKKGTLPLLNVSPQRLASPVGMAEEPVYENNANQAEFSSSRYTDFSEPEVTFADVKPRYGTAVSLESSNTVRHLKKSTTSERAELKIKTLPPENLIVGAEATFTIEVRNETKTISEGSVIEIAIPDWFTVRNASVERGTTAVLPNSLADGQRCVWNLGVLLPNATETLNLTVIPQRSASADFRISWSNQKAETQAVVAEAPKLEMQIDSMRSVEEGQPLPLNIRISNTGNCVARDIAVQLKTEGCVENNYIIPGIRRLLPGEEETVQVIVTPATRRTITCCAEALIQNQRFSRVENQIVVQYLDLNVEIPEIEKIFTGTDVSVPIKITNYGNAVAEKVQVFLELPSQVRVIRAEPDVMYHEPAPNQLILELNDIPSHQTEALKLQLRAEEEGSLNIPCTIQVNSRTLAKGNIPLHVEGIASMQMNLNFPTRVLSTTEFGTCEVTVKNNGTQTISDGKLQVFFSDGIEPVQTMAFSSEVLESGVISFDVAELKPGEEHTFQVQAQVREPGNYPIRCQLKSESAGLDLIQQETAIYR